MTQSEPFLAPTGSGQSYWTRLLLVATVGGILAIVLVFPFSQSGRQWSELFNLAHAPSFFLAFLLVAGLFDPTCIGFPQSWQKILPLGPLHLSVLVSVLLVLGVACEVLQEFVGRSPSVSDVVANGCGLVAGLCWCLSRQRMQSSGRFGLSVITAGLLVVASWSPVCELHDFYLQHQDFPLLASFERPRELHTWYADEAAIDQSTTWSTHGSASLRVRGSAGTEYPGASLQAPVRNWDGYAALELDVFNPGGQPLTLRISISDRLHAASGHATTDRFRTSVELPADQHVHVRIELAGVRNSPAARPMDLSQIESLNLFIVRPEADVIFMVDHVRLAEY